MTDNLICIAVITKPHGIQGEAKLISYADKPENIFNYSHFYDESLNQYKIKKRAVNSNVFIVRISKAQSETEPKEYNKITSRNEIEDLAGQNLYITKSMLSPIKENEYYFEDLKDVEIKDQDNKLYGHVIEMRNFGGGDLLIVKRPDHKETIYLPFLKEFIIEVNLEQKYLIFDFVTSGL
jgi:16S rRNA processing protein RimM